MPQHFGGHDDHRSGERHRPEAHPAAAIPKRVLVIDDDEAVRQSLGAILTARGYLFVEAASGQAALNYLRQPRETIDAVILDVNMPGMNGREVLAALRIMHPRLPVILASGHDFAGPATATDTCLRLVQKSHGPRALLMHLGELLQPAA
jgi:two-component system, response regulator FlrC